MGKENTARWDGHPWLARLLQLAILLVPVGMSCLATWILVHLYNPTQQRWLWLGALCLVALLVGALAERVVRRFTPLATLLRLTMLFPDRAPSRLKVVRSASSHRSLVERLRRDDDDDSQTAAEKVLALITALGNHDRRTRGHSERVRVFTDLLAEELRLPQQARDRLRWAALLHDVGKLRIAPAILNKPARLDDAEFTAMKRHPQTGAELAAPLLPWLGEWGEGILDHHERYDGKGYPRGLAGTAISRAGRMLNVVDAFETMTAARPYKKPMPTRLAREELTRCAGSQFDSDYVRAFLAISLPRLLFAMGPMTCVAQLPFLRSLAEAGNKAAVAGTQASTTMVAGVASVAAAGTLSAVAVMPAADPPADHPRPPVGHSASLQAAPAAAVPQPKPARRTTSPAAPVAAASTPVAPASPTPSSPIPSPPESPSPVPPPPSSTPAPTSPTPTSPAPTPTSPAPTPTSPAPTPTPTSPAPTPTPTPTTPAPTPTPTTAAPGAPASVTVVAGDAQATVTWTPPLDDGGSPVTSYTVIPTSPTGPLTPVTVASGVTSTVVSGLTNGVSYTFEVTATNAVGVSPFAGSTPVTPAGLPAPPTSVSAVAGDGDAVVSWTAPTDDGGAALTGYQIEAYAGGPAPALQWTVAPDATAYDATGLTNGTGYTFVVVAVNAVGAQPSTPSSSVTPAAPPPAATVPDVPASFTATAASTSATLSWAAPASDGGSAVTHYVVTATVGGSAAGSWTFGPGATSASIGSLTDGTTYTFSITAVNAVGASAAATSAPVTPASPPGPVTALVVTPGDGQVAVSWSAPSNTGGTPLTGYTVQATGPAGPLPAVPVAAGATGVTLTGLTDGYAYTVSVVATNAAGTSAPTVSAPVTLALPSPTGVTATAGDSTATVTWAAPASGPTPTSYVVSAWEGSKLKTTATVSAPQTTATVTGLENGKAYTFTVVAVSAAGTSPPSAPSAAVTPVKLVTPPPPTHVTATGGVGSATVSWQPPNPVPNGPIDEYVITVFDSANKPTGQTVVVDGNTTSVTVTGLTLGLSYRLGVASSNSAGTSGIVKSGAVIVL